MKYIRLKKKAFDTSNLSMLINTTYILNKSQGLPADLAIDEALRMGIEKGFISQEDYDNNETYQTMGDFLIKELDKQGVTLTASSRKADFNKDILIQILYNIVEYSNENQDVKLFADYVYSLVLNYPENFNESIVIARELDQLSNMIQDPTIKNKLDTNPLSWLQASTKTKKVKTAESFNTWFDRFLSEKGLNNVYQTWEITDSSGFTHFIDSEVVIEAIKGAPPNEQSGIKDMLVRIDFANGDVMDYFKHLAKALVSMY